MSSHTANIALKQTSSGEILVSKLNTSPIKPNKASKKFKQAEFYMRQRAKSKDKKGKAGASKMDEFVTEGPNPLIHLFERMFDSNDLEIFKTEGITDIISGVFSMPGKFNDTMDGIHTATRSMHSVAEILSNVEDLPGGFTSISQAAQRFAEEGANVNHVFKIEPMYEAIICMVVLCWFYQRDDIPSKVLTLCSAIYMLYLASKNPVITVPIVGILTHILERFGLFAALSSGDTFHTAGPSLQSGLGLAGSLVMLLGSCMNYKVDPDVGLLHKFMQVTNSAATSIDIGRTSFSSITNLVIFFQDLINIVPTMFGSEWRANFTGEYWAELDRQKEEYLTLRDEFEKRKDLSSVARKANSLLKEVEKVSVKRTSGLYAQHRDLRNSLNLLVTELKGFGACGNGERQEPFVIVVSGSPGVGKSYVSKSIQTVFARKLLSASAFDDFGQGRTANLTWCPNLVESFDSGYNNQPFVLCDDLGYSTEANKVTIPKFISWVNQQPLQTNQAELGRKGNIFFDSKVILCTSNTTDFSRADQSLTCPEALCRRLHYCLFVELKPEWAGPDGKLDIRRAMKASGGEMDSCFWLDFKLFNPATGQVHEFDKEMRFYDITCAMIDTYDFRNGIHDAKTEQSKRFAHRLAGLRGDFTANLASVLSEPNFKTEGLWKCHPACVSCNNLSADDIEKNIIDTTKELDKIICSCCNRMLDRAVPGNYYPEKGCVAKDIRVDGVVKKINLDCNYEYNAYVIACKFNYVKKVPIVTLFSWVKTQLYNILLTVHNKLNSIFGSSWEIIVGAIAFASTAGLLWKYLKRNEPEPARTQSRDDNAVQLRRKLINHNVVWAFTNLGERIGAMLAIGGELLLMNRHTYCQVELGKVDRVLLRKFSVNKPAHTFEVSGATFSHPDNVHYFVDCDLVALRLPKFSGTNIISQFADEKLTWSQARTRDVGLAFWEPTSSGQAESTILHGTARGFKAIDAVGPCGNRYLTKSTFEYSFPTYSGLCCAPVVLDDVKMDAKIVGVHIAGSDSTSRGYGAVVTRQMLDEVVMRFKPLLPQVNCNVMIRAKVNYDTLPDNPVLDAEVVGTCDRKKPNYRTELCRSPLFLRIADVPPVKYPAILSPKYVDGKFVDPIVLNITDYSRGSSEPIPQLFRGAELAYLAMIKRNCSDPVHIDEISFEEAVAGDKYKVPNLVSINRSTSTGFPDGEFFKDKKRSIFGIDEFEFTSAECKYLMENVDEMYKHLANGPIDVICSVFPKDELRPIEKVKTLKTRLIMSASISSSILTRMVFATYIDWFLEPKNRLKNWSAVGIDMASEDDLLQYVNYHHCGSTNYRTFAGDFSGFDKRLSAWLMESSWKVFEMYTRSYRSVSDMNRARNLYYSNTHPKMQVNDSLIQWSNSNPSGWPLTTPLNTTANCIANMYAIPYIILGPSASESEVSKFWHFCNEHGHVRFTGFGDDGVLTVIKGVHGGYDFDKVTYNSLAEAFDSIGLVYTDEQKSLDFDESDRTIFDVTFLKRKVRRSEIGLVACLDVNTIVQNIQWKKRDDVNLEIWHDKLENFLNELSIHPDDVWDYYYPRLVEAYNGSVSDLIFSFEPTKLERMHRWRTSSLLLQ